MANIIVKNYEHFNRVLNKHIGSKAQYEKEMAKQGFVSWEQGERLVAKAKERKPYGDISDKAREVIQAAKMSADKKGNIKCSDRLIDGMKSVGVCFDKSKMPKEMRGGFK